MIACVHQPVEVTTLFINMDPDQDPHLLYKVQQIENDKYIVVNSAGRIIMTCHDKPSASHYMTLLNEAFKAGYKAGLRDNHSA